MRFVDAHLHLWDVENVPLSWFRPGEGLPHRARVSELLAELDGDNDARPDAAVVVQAADTLEELSWLLAIADEHPLVAAVVAQYEPQAGAWAGIAHSVLSHPALAGVRLAVPTRAADLSDVDDLDDLAAGLTEHGRVLEMLIRSEQLAAVAAIAARHPHLSIVVCHLGLGAREPDDAWRQGIRAVARHPGVVAKVSGLHSRGDDRARVQQVVSDAVEILGIDRLMFGSDWPISTRTCGYPETLQRTRAALPALTDAQAESFWWGLATRLYLS